MKRLLLLLLALVLAASPALAYTPFGDPCLANTKLTAHFSSTTSGGSLITASAGKKAYICWVSAITSAAANVSLIEGTGSSVCTGGTVAPILWNVGTTVANGASFAANAGESAGASIGTIAVNGTVNQNICPIFVTTNNPLVTIDAAYVLQ